MCSFLEKHFALTRSPVSEGGKWWRKQNLAASIISSKDPPCIIIIRCARVCLHVCVSMCVYMTLTSYYRKDQVHFPKPKCLTSSPSSKQHTTGVTKVPVHHRNLGHEGTVGQSNVGVGKNQVETSLTECYWNSLFTRPKMCSLTKVLHWLNFPSHTSSEGHRQRQLRFIHLG